MAEPAHYLEESLKVDTSHLITEDDEPLDNPFQERQQAILTDCLYASWKGFPEGTPFVSLRNVGVFGSVKESAIVPDVLLALGVELLPVNEYRAYFCWEYGKPPDLVVEVISKEPGGENTSKLERYRDIGVPYYVVYNPFGFRGERVLKAYQRHGLSYIDIANPKILPELGLGFAIWEGSYQGCDGRFLRFVDEHGQLLLSGDERAEQERERAEQQRERAEHAHERAEQEHERAEQEHERAEQERERADAAQQRAEQLAKKLRELGVDSD